MVFVGEGKKAADYPKGKSNYIAVVQLLNVYSDYSTPQFAAKAAGASAVIMFPPAGLPDYPTLKLSPAGNAAKTATTGKVEGAALLGKMNSLPTGQYISMKFAGGALVDNPAKDTMSHFSSYGSPSTLDFKPELTAPGGNIYSTMPGNQCEMMSGTSMANPHVEGGSAFYCKPFINKD
jgi:lactocepin